MRTDARQHRAYPVDTERAREDEAHKLEQFRLKSGSLLYYRALRYTPQGLRAPRHARVHTDGAFELPDDERYLREREDLSREDRSATTLRQQWRDQMPQGLREPLERVGEAVFPPGKVSGPRVHGGSGHDKNYEWFVSNDKEGKALQPLGSRDTGRAAEAGWPAQPKLRPPSKRG